MDEVESVVLSTIAARSKRPAEPADDLSRLGLDSLAMAEVAVEIEQRLGVRLDEGILDQRTLGDLIEHVRMLRSGQRQPQQERRGS
jgi:acyl carrier protein